jgi:SP family general alpha glucoside:H+ symporter-like MFS transporter
MWAFVIPYLFNPDQANLGARVAFIFGAFAVLSTIYLWIYQPETSGRSFAELDEMFMRKRIETVDGLCLNELGRDDDVPLVL